MKIVVFEAEDWEAEACAALLPDHDLRCTPDSLSAANAPEFLDAEAVTTFVNSRLDRPVLTGFSGLKLIATRSTGYDHIDLEYCRQTGIAVANVPSYGDVTVAEHVFALLLGLARNLVPTVQGLRAGRFDQSGLRGFDLHGKTIGVIGTGRIGRRVIDIAQGFGMAVLACDVAPDHVLAERRGFRYTDLETLLRNSDIVTLHVPALPATRSLIGEREFGMMKAEAVLINTARGSVVDVEALVRAVTTGRIRGAGLDVLPEEPLMRDEAEVFRIDAIAPADLKALVANHVLMAAPNVLVTPHVAYNTVEARRRIIDTTIDNIRSFVDGRPMNLV